MASNLRTTLELTCLGVAAAAAPLLDRLYLRMHEGTALSSRDLVGALSDLGVSLIVAALLISTIARLRLVAMGIAVIWCFLNYASFEHIRLVQSMDEGALAPTRRGPVGGVVDRRRLQRR